MLSNQLVYFEEPKLIFGHNQTAQDPRDGLVLFGPCETFKSNSVRAGFVGTKDGLSSYKEFVKRLNLPIKSKKRRYGVVLEDELGRPSFPGFEAVFNVKWPEEPEIFLEIKEVQILLALGEKSRKLRVNTLVDIFLEQIKIASNDEDNFNSVNIWFIVIPVDIYKKCRPQSAGKEISASTKNFIDLTKKGQTLIFEEDKAYVDEIERLLDTTSDFHHLLKARLIQEKIDAPAQIIVEPTLKFRDKLKNKEYEDNMKCHLAWTQSTTIYYKLGKLPWRLNDVRNDVCYLGLIFKKSGEDKSKNVCSAAQMFLKDGDGSIFRGNIGLWETKEGEYHLDKYESASLIGLALDDYHSKWNKWPRELFIHGRSHFTDDEWEGFQNALKTREAETILTGIVIKAESGKLKLYRDAEGEVYDYGVIRGLAMIPSEKEAYLFTKGFVPRLNTSLSLEIPNPLRIIISRGEADMKQVLADILALTKLNYNACVFGDGLPVTLRFSDNIGNILTATAQWKAEKRQFAYYI